VGEMKYEYGIVIGTPAGRDLLEDLDLDGIFLIIIGFKMCLKCQMDSVV
jgi:hypothetical protein